MKIIHLSDTHNLHYALPDLPAADIIVHSGDVSMSGTADEIADFIDWFDSLDGKHKIFIGGNHDFCLEDKDPLLIRKFLPEDMHYLCNSGVTIAGLRFWGIPYFISGECHHENYRKALASIPNDIDILLTHCPPFEILDVGRYGNMGCPQLLDAVRRIRPHYHLFGHIHDAYGSMSDGKTTFINGAILNEEYEFDNAPVSINL
ncbi:MAG: metallophosphatase domain-containing protein [Tannerellaceae bacterium]|jgi:Icc-related predicted phosphoesterase|nr:metallophosphatase domain-containing protein [Tannerellaceae bacterium]